MNKNQVATAKQADRIPCLLLPLHGRQLLAPTVTVAEVVPMIPYQEAAGGPAWFLGYFPWRGLEVPLLSFEILSGEAEAPIVPQGRVAVLNNTGVSEQLPFIAIPMLGIPRLSRITAEDIAENTSALKRSCELMQVKVGMEELVIPDVSALERAYVELGKL